MKHKPDLVISGINLGANDGCSVFYSGTVAGAREGAILGIPSIAVSLATFVDPDFAYAAKIAARLARVLTKRKMPSGTFLNVNIPAQPVSRIKGIKITRQGMEPIHSTFYKRTDPHSRNYYWMSGKMPPAESDLAIDTYALSRHYITVTPIHCDFTDYMFLNELAQWKI